MINIIFLGHLNNKALIGGVGMGQAVIQLMGFSIILGLNSALDTLISQSAGAGNIENCGVLLNRARYITSIMFIPLFLMSFKIEDMLLYFDQDPEVSYYA
jgi:MATE family multidrug resistance protein